MENSTFKYKILQKHGFPLLVCSIGLGPCWEGPNETIPFHSGLNKNFYKQCLGYKSLHVCLKESCTHYLMNLISLSAAKGPEK